MCLEDALPVHEAEMQRTMVDAFPIWCYTRFVKRSTASPLLQHARMLPDVPQRHVFVSELCVLPSTSAAAGGRRTVLRRAFVFGNQAADGSGCLEPLTAWS